MGDDIDDSASLPGPIGLGEPVEGTRAWLLAKMDRMIGEAQQLTAAARAMACGEVDADTLRELRRALTELEAERTNIHDQLPGATS